MCFRSVNLSFAFSWTLLILDVCIGVMQESASTRLFLGVDAVSLRQLARSGELEYAANELSFCFPTVKEIGDSLEDSCFYDVRFAAAFVSGCIAR